MIRFDRVCKRYGSNQALDEVTWEVEAGERVVVLGHSGAGKTTLLRLLAMETVPSTGTVQVGSFHSNKLSASKRKFFRRTLGVIFEEANLLPDRTVYDNLAISLYICGIWDRKEVDSRVRRALDEIGAGGRVRQRPHELSAGERQRVSVARALVREPSLIIADEPTGNLDPPAADQVLATLRKANERGVTVVLSTNDESQCERFDGRVTRLVDGRIPLA